MKIVVKSISSRKLSNGENHCTMTVSGTVPPGMDPKEYEQNLQGKVSQIFDIAVDSLTSSVVQSMSTSIDERDKELQELRKSVAILRHENRLLRQRAKWPAPK